MSYHANQSNTWSLSPLTHDHSQVQSLLESLTNAGLLHLTLVPWLLTTSWIPLSLECNTHLSPPLVTFCNTRVHGETLTMFCQYIHIRFQARYSGKHEQTINTHCDLPRSHDDSQVCHPVTAALCVCLRCFRDLTAWACPSPIVHIGVPRDTYGPLRLLLWLKDQRSQSPENFTGIESMWPISSTFWDQKFQGMKNWPNFSL